MGGHLPVRTGYVDASIVTLLANTKNEDLIMKFRFLKDENGAVTVDWTVMTAAIVGLGIATFGVVSNGMRDLTTDTSRHLSSFWIKTSFGMQTFASMDFTGGNNGGWNGGTVMSPIEALGEVLVLGPGEKTKTSIDVPAGTSTAQLSFDLVGGGFLNHDVAKVTTNGKTVTLARGWWKDGSMNFTVKEVEGMTVTTETISEGTNLGGNRGRDSVTRVTVTVDDPSETLDLAIISGANQPVRNEFFGIDNVDLAAE